MDRWELEKKIALECIKNPKFKKRFLAHPNEAITELFKDTKGFNAKLIHFSSYEEKKNEMHISIPFIEGGLPASEEELRRVSGGTYPTFTGISCLTMGC